MPRGIKKIVPIDEQIAEIQSNIDTLETRLKAQKTKLKELEKRKKTNDLSALAAVIEEKGLSIEKAIMTIKGEG